jgi:hypothetical protein
VKQCLSECEPHSDRSVGEKQQAVRMGASFGRVRWGRGKSSPNASLIRTGLLEKAESSPNASLIRTGSIEKSQKQFE